MHKWRFLCLRFFPQAAPDETVKAPMHRDLSCMQLWLLSRQLGRSWVSPSRQVWLPRRRRQHSFVDLRCLANAHVGFPSCAGRRLGASSRPEGLCILSAALWNAVPPHGRPAIRSRSRKPAEMRNHLRSQLLLRLLGRCHVSEIALFTCCMASCSHGDAGAATAPEAAGKRCRWGDCSKPEVGMLQVGMSGVPHAQITDIMSGVASPVVAKSCGI